MNTSAEPTIYNRRIPAPSDEEIRAICDAQEGMGVRLQVKQVAAYLDATRSKSPMKLFHFGTGVGKTLMILLPFVVDLLRWRRADPRVRGKKPLLRLVCGATRAEELAETLRTFPMGLVTIRRDGFRDNEFPCRFYDEHADMAAIAAANIDVVILSHTLDSRAPNVDIGQVGVARGRICDYRVRSLNTKKADAGEKSPIASFWHVCLQLRKVFTKRFGSSSDEVKRLLSLQVCITHTVGEVLADLCYVPHFTTCSARALLVMCESVGLSHADSNEAAVMLTMLQSRIEGGHPTTTDRSPLMCRIMSNYGKFTHVAFDEFFASDLTITKHIGSAHPGLAAFIYCACTDERCNLGGGFTDESLVKGDWPFVVTFASATATKCDGLSSVNLTGHASYCLMKCIHEVNENQINIDRIAHAWKDIPRSKTLIANTLSMFSCVKWANAPASFWEVYRVALEKFGGIWFWWSDLIATLNEYNPEQVLTPHQLLDRVINEGQYWMVHVLLKRRHFKQEKLSELSHDEYRALCKDVIKYVEPYASQYTYNHRKNKPDGEQNLLQFQDHRVYDKVPMEIMDNIDKCFGKPLNERLKGFVTQGLVRICAETQVLKEVFATECTDLCEQEAAWSKLWTWYRYLQCTITADYATYTDGMNVLDTLFELRRIVSEMEAREEARARRGASAKSCSALTAHEKTHLRIAADRAVVWSTQAAAATKAGAARDTAAEIAGEAAGAAVVHSGGTTNDAVEAAAKAARDAGGSIDAQEQAANIAKEKAALTSELACQVKAAANDLCEHLTATSPATYDVPSRMKIAFVGITDFCADEADLKGPVFMTINKSELQQRHSEDGVKSSFPQWMTPMRGISLKCVMAFMCGHAASTSKLCSVMNNPEVMANILRMYRESEPSNKNIQPVSGYKHQALKSLSKAVVQNLGSKTSGRYFVDHTAMEEAIDFLKREQPASIIINPLSTVNVWEDGSNALRDRVVQLTGRFLRRCNYMHSEPVHITITNTSSSGLVGLMDHAYECLLYNRRRWVWYELVKPSFELRRSLATANHVDLCVSGIWACVGNTRFGVRGDLRECFQSVKDFLFLQPGSQVARCSAGAMDAERRELAETSEQHVRKVALQLRDAIQAYQLDNPVSSTPHVATDEQITAQGREDALFQLCSSRESAKKKRKRGAGEK